MRAPLPPLKDNFNNRVATWFVAGRSDTPEARQEAMKSTGEDWATEILLAARQAQHATETGKRLLPGQKLSDAYLEANPPVVRRRSISLVFVWRVCGQFYYK
jgi:hypothetical protein